jgi:hypothetical protein
VEERPKEGSEGYPEEQPGDVAGEGAGTSRRDADEGDTPAEAGRGDEDTATGNRRSAG